MVLPSWKLSKSYAALRVMQASLSLSGSRGTRLQEHKGVPGATTTRGLSSRGRYAPAKSVRHKTPNNQVVKTAQESLSLLHPRSIVPVRPLVTLASTRYGLLG